MTQKNRITVFSKAWPGDSVEDLARRIRSLGFDGLELTVRDGYQVTPERAGQDLPVAAEVLRDHGLEIHSVASELTESVFDGCGKAGIRLIRIQVPVSVDSGYFVSRDAFRKELDDLRPLCETYGVSVGIQIHSGRFLARSTEIMEMIRDLDPWHASIVWDVGHAAVSGEDAEYGLATCGEHLSLVNFKNFRFVQSGNGYVRENCIGEDGLGSWPDAVRAIREIGYHGACCISAHYPKDRDIDALAKLDRVYLDSLLGR